MRIGLISTVVPLVKGGSRFIVDWLHEKLVERGHEVEIVYIPNTDELPHVLPQMAALRMMKIDDYFERVIAIRPPAHMVQHPRKVVWLIHHLRIFYDLWDTPYCPVGKDAAGHALRSAVITADNLGLGEAHRLFTNSRIVGDRVRHFNGLESEVLYPPVLRPEIFRAGDYGDTVVSVCRIEHHKRQHLLIEALEFTRTPVRVHLCGTSMDQGYIDRLRNTVRSLDIAHRVTIEDRWITETEKADLLEHALASAYLPFDEDSYGYPTIEAAHAQRCTLTASDAGGVLEFVIDGVTGLVAEPRPEAIAEAMDQLFTQKSEARRLGRAAEVQIRTLGIDWDTVIDKLLS